MADRSAIKDWMEGYIQAWNSNDREDIGRLFSDEAQYFTGPFQEPWRGREGVIEGWLERKDEPGSFEFKYEILAVENQTGVVRGLTHYSTDPARTYSNIWLICLNDRGECTEFTEWWMKKK